MDYYFTVYCTYSFKIFHLYCLYVITWDPTVTMWHCKNALIYPLCNEPPEAGCWQLKHTAENRRNKRKYIVVPNQTCVYIFLIIQASLLHEKYSIKP